MRRASWSAVLAAAGATVVAGALVVPAGAATLTFQSSSPAAGSVVQPPSVLSATYNGQLDAGTATVTLVDSLSAPVATTAPQLSPNGRTVSAAPVAPLADGAYTVTFDVQDDTLTDHPTPEVVAFTVDGTPPTTPTSVTFDTGPLTVADTSVVVSGDGESGASVSVSVDDADGNTTAVQAPGPITVVDGHWSTAEFSVASLADGTLTATVTQTDAAGNVSGQSKDATILKDATAPSASAGLGFDGPATATDTEVVLSGDGETGASVSWSVDDTAEATAPVTGNTTVVDGHWSSGPIEVEGPGPDPILVDGTLTATVTHTDGVGNESTEATATVAKDVVVPAAPTGLGFDGPATATDQSVVLGGAGEPGATVTYTVDDAIDPDPSTPAIPGTAVVAGNGQWTTGALDVSGFADGTLTATAVQTDAVGNEGPPSSPGTAVKDTVVPSAPAALAFDGVVKKLDQTVVLSGSGENGATVSISVDDGDGGTTPVTGQTTVADGVWSKSLNLSTLADGTLTATVRQSDAVGNDSSTATKTVLKDTIVLAPSAMTFDDPVSLKENALILTGHGEPGADVTVRLGNLDAGPLRITRTPTVVGDGTWTATFAYSDVIELADGTLTATVRQVDGVGNQSPAAQATVKKDTKRPTVTLLGPTARFTLGATRISWDGTGASSYDVGYIQSRSGGYLGSAIYPDPWQRIATESVSRSQPLGTTDCYFVRGRDSVGNTSFFTPQRCTTRPFDDRALSASSGWTKDTGKAFYRQTVRRTTQRGATLTLGTTFVYRVGLVATTCDGCGKVAVMVNGVQLGLFDLQSNRTRHHRVLSMTVPEQSGKVVLKVVSARKKVEVDGFAVTRV